MKQSYIQFAIIVTSFLVFILVLNLLAAGGLWISYKFGGVPPQWIPYFKHRWLRYRDIPKVYPGWSAKDVLELESDTQELFSIKQYVYDEVTQLRPLPLATRFVNVEAAGFRRIKNQGPWPPDQSSVNVFVFGGSTTFGILVADGDTIASYLQMLSWQSDQGRSVRVYNFGCSGYTSTQELLLYLSLLRAGFAPNVAIFIDGLNDSQMGPEAGLPLTPTPASTIQDAVEAARQLRNPWTQALRKMPIVKAVNELKRLRRGGVHSRHPPSSYPAVVRFVIRRWLQNKQAIEALCRSYNIACVFVWQPVPDYKYDLKYDVFGAPRYHRTFWAIPLVFPKIEEMGNESQLGDDFLNLSGIQAEKKENLYVDLAHYTAAFSEDIARHIYSFLVQRKLLDGGSRLPAR
jgi:GDSL-like Lipase/Acylhydrolase family